MSTEKTRNDLSKLVCLFLGEKRRYLASSCNDQVSEPLPFFDMVDGQYRVDKNLIFTLKGCRRKVKSKSIICIGKAKTFPVTANFWK